MSRDTNYNKSAIRSGRSAIATPARRRACTFVAASPADGLMMAPACPMRFPAGALCPDMKATTFLLTDAAMNSAASSSAAPPISPMRTIASV